MAVYYFERTVRATAFGPRCSGRAHDCRCTHRAANFLICWMRRL